MEYKNLKRNLDGLLIFFLKNTFPFAPVLGINNDQSLMLQTKILLTSCKLAPKDYFWRKIKLN